MKNSSRFALALVTLSLMSGFAFAEQSGRDSLTPDQFADAVMNDTDDTPAPAPANDRFAQERELSRQRSMTLPPTKRADAIKYANGCNLDTMKECDADKARAYNPNLYDTVKYRVLTNGMTGGRFKNNQIMFFYDHSSAMQAGRQLQGMGYTIKPVCGFPNTASCYGNVE